MAYKSSGNNLQRFLFLDEKNWIYQTSDLILNEVFMAVFIFIICDIM